MRYRGMKTKAKSRVLYLGPSLGCSGGISSVLRSYSRTIPHFRFLPTNSRHGTALGALVLASTFLRLPFYRLSGMNILHVHGAGGKSFYRKRMLLRWARLLGFRTIFHCHSGGFREFVESTGGSVVPAIRQCDGIVALGKVWKQYFCEELGCTNVHIINNIVEQPQRTATAVKRSNVLTLLFIGMICDNKGIYDLLKALEDNRSAFEGRVRVRFAGTGETDKLRRYIAEHRLENMSEYIGPIYGEDKDRELRNCGALILPSHFEGMPIVVLEAASYRRPSIVTRVGSVEEFVEDGATGKLILPHSPESITEGIKYYLDSPERLEVEGDEAARRVDAYYPDAVAKSLTALYEKL